MGSKRAQVEDLITRLRGMGCEVDTNQRGHYRVTYRGAYVGAIGSSPSTTTGLDHSMRKIRNRINLYKSTGRTWG
jgi:hypothetical protein